jgi:hypothetical protein
MIMEEKPRIVIAKANTAMRTNNLGVSVYQPPGARQPDSCLKIRRRSFFAFWNRILYPVGMRSFTPPWPGLNG